MQQLKRYEDQCAKAGIHHAHGHRHQYAQDRYRTLTGRAAPAAGGLRSEGLTRSDKEKKIKGINKKTSHPYEPAIVEPSPIMARMKGTRG